MRLTRKVFHDLAIWMVAFGLLIGLVFPFFVMGMGVPADVALTWPFFVACLCAGAFAGIINFTLGRLIVGQRICILADGMRRVEGKLKAMAGGESMNACTPEACSIPVDSEDELGDSARAFNTLVATLASAMETEAAYRTFSQMLSSNLEVETLSENALSMFVVYCVVRGGAVLYEDEGELKVAASHGLKNAESLTRSDYVRSVFESGEPRYIELPEDIAMEGVLADFRPREVCILPATYKRVALGVIVLGGSTVFTQEQRNRMTMFRHGLGLALNNAMAHDRLKRLAALDSLTGMYNRRFGMGRFNEEFGRAVRSKAPLGILMMDIDHFKAVNDTYGHMVGDRVIKMVARCIRTVLREGDVLTRYGGEEFLAVFPAASIDDLRDLGERIRRSIEDSSLSAGTQNISITLSLGGAAYPQNAVANSDALVQLADQALYSAKESGRNRLELAHTSSATASGE